MSGVWDIDLVVAQLVAVYARQGAAQANLAFKQAIYVYDLNDWEARALRQRFVAALRHEVDRG